MLASYPSPLAEISLSALKDNYKLLSRRLSPAPLLCIVKADAYGHGAGRCVRALREAGARLFAVANGTEALALASAFDKENAFCKDNLTNIPSLHILGSVTDEELLPLTALSVSLSVHSLAYASALNGAIEAAKRKGALSADYRLPISIKCESGMNRLGITHTASALAVLRLKSLIPVALYSHLAEADTAPNARTEAQVRRFHAFSSLLSRAGDPLFTHLSASAASLRFGTLGADGARAGLALYGISPSSLPLRAVMRLSASVLSVKRVRRGEGVGYGAYRAPRDMLVACLAIGYADGLPVGASGARVRVGGRLCPIVGDVCMDRTFLDIGGARVREGDFLTLFGADAADTRRFAEECGVSPYVLLSVRSPRTKKIFY